MEREPTATELRADLLLGEVDPTSVAGAHTQFCRPQGSSEAGLEPWWPVVHVPHQHRDGGHGGEEGFVGNGAVEHVLQHKGTGWQVRGRRGRFLAAGP